MADFDLDNSRWYCMMKIGLACKNSKQNAADIIDRTRVLGSFEYEPTIGSELSQAEMALSEALFAVKVAREEYENHAKPTLVAAE